MSEKPTKKKKHLLLLSLACVWFLRPFSFLYFFFFSSEVKGQEEKKKDDVHTK